MAVRVDGPRAAEKPHVTLRLARPVLDAVLNQQTTFVDQIAQGNCRIDGDAQALLTFRSLLADPDRDFPILTP